MISLSTWLTAGGRILLIGLFAVVLAGCPPPGSRQPDHGDCEAGCMGHAAAGEAAINGGTCTTGLVCNTPGASCVIGGAKRCRNFNMGGGNCTCACM